MVIAVNSGVQRSSGVKSGVSSEAASTQAPGFSVLLAALMNLVIPQEFQVQGSQGSTAPKTCVSFIEGEILQTVVSGDQLRGQQMLCAFERVENGTLGATVDEADTRVQVNLPTRAEMVIANGEIPEQTVGSDAEISVTTEAVDPAPIGAPYPSARPGYKEIVVSNHVAKEEPVRQETLLAQDDTVETKIAKTTGEAGFLKIQPAESHLDSDDRFVKPSEVKTVKPGEEPFTASLMRDKGLASVEPREGYRDPQKLSANVAELRTLSSYIAREAKERLPRSVRIRLDPPELGELTVKLTARGNQVAVKFIAASEQAKTLLNDSLVDLCRSLAEKGFLLEGFSAEQQFGTGTRRETRSNPQQRARGAQEAKRQAEARVQMVPTRGVIDYLA